MLRPAELAAACACRLRKDAPTHHNLSRKLRTAIRVCRSKPHLQDGLGENVLCLSEWFGKVNTMHGQYKHAL